MGRHPCGITRAGLRFDLRTGRTECTGRLVVSGAIQARAPETRTLWRFGATRAQRPYSAEQYLGMRLADGEELSAPTHPRDDASVSPTRAPSVGS